MKSLFTLRLRATAALAFLDSECRLRQPFKLRGIQFHRAVFRHLLHQLVRDVVEHENFLFADAQQIVVITPRRQ